MENNGLLTDSTSSTQVVENDGAVKEQTCVKSRHFEETVIYCTIRARKVRLK